MEYFAELDVSSWRPEGHEPLGTKPKLWLADPATEVDWLFKSTTSNNRADGSTYRKGDDWAERIATALAVEIGLPVATTELAFDDTGDDIDFGIVSRKVLSGNESLIHGNELLAEAGVSGTHAKDRTGYNLDAVRRVLDLVEPPSQGGSFSAWEWFVGYLVLDALVANTDRHQENWAVIDLEGVRRLASTFDHASSLGFQLDDEERSERLATKDRRRQVPFFASRAQSRFEGNPHPCAVAAQGLSMVGPTVRDHWLGCCDEIQTIEPIIGRVPERRMSQPARDLASRLFETNRDRMLSHPQSTVVT